MTGMKRGSAAQVVLLPEGEIGQAVLRLAERWTLEGLLDPVYWVPANSVIEHSLIPAQVSAIVMGRTSDGQVERRGVGLLATLGGDKLEEVVISSVRGGPVHGARVLERVRERGARGQRRAYGGQRLEVRT